MKLIINKLGHRGTVYIEYFVLALIVSVATIAFFGNFRTISSHGTTSEVTPMFLGAATRVEEAFDAMVARMVGGSGSAGELP